MRKILNAPSEVVTEYLNGLELAHPDVVRFEREHRIVVRANAVHSPKVGLVSGGGSGCEPLHAGYVGQGMLDAACPGEVFTSPVPAQIIAATKAADSGAGVLYIIKNFGGEVMNFGLAAEILQRQGVEVAKVLVDDDSSFGPEMKRQRRGLGATVLVEKIAGAAAEQGRPLKEVADIARRVVSASRTFGIALSSCTPPKLGRATFDLPEGQFEVGVGIGGDRGQERRDLMPASQIADLLMQQPIRELDITSGTRVLTLLSGLGSTPQIELYSLFGLIADRLRQLGAVPTRSLVGNYVTSLDSFGVLLTFLVLEDDLCELWDAPVNTPALRWGV